METVERRCGAVVLAGPGETRVVGSPQEALRALDAGFRPAVVLLGAGPAHPEADALARRMSADRAGATIPVLAASGDGERIRLTLVSEVAPPAASIPEQLAIVLGLLDELSGGAVQLV
jgi:hypothetical protein